VPTFAWDDELFFGNDWFDLLLWTIEKHGLRQQETAGGATDPAKPKSFP
jgi:hypothetical protein